MKKGVQHNKFLIKGLMFVLMFSLLAYPVNSQYKIYIQNDPSYYAGSLCVIAPPFSKVYLADTSGTTLSIVEADSRGCAKISYTAIFQGRGGLAIGKALVYSTNRTSGSFLQAVTVWGDPKYDCYSCSGSYEDMISRDSGKCQKGVSDYYCNHNGRLISCGKDFFECNSRCDPDRGCVQVTTPSPPGVTPPPPPPAQPNYSVPVITTGNFLDIIGKSGSSTPLIPLVDSGNNYVQWNWENYSKIYNMLGVSCEDACKNSRSQGKDYYAVCTSIGDVFYEDGSCYYGFAYPNLNKYADELKGKQALFIHDCVGNCACYAYKSGCRTKSSCKMDGCDGKPAPAPKDQTKSCQFICGYINGILGGSCTGSTPPPGRSGDYCIVRSAPANSWVNSGWGNRYFESEVYDSFKSTCECSCYWIEYCPPPNECTANGCRRVDTPGPTPVPNPPPPTTPPPPGSPWTEGDQLPVSCASVWDCGEPEKTPGWICSRYCNENRCTQTCYERRGCTRLQDCGPAPQKFGYECIWVDCYEGKCVESCTPTQAPPLGSLQGVIFASAGTTDFGMGGPLHRRILFSSQQNCQKDSDCNVDLTGYNCKSSCKSGLCEVDCLHELACPPMSNCPLTKPGCDTACVGGWCKEICDEYNPPPFYYKKYHAFACPPLENCPIAMEGCKMECKFGECLETCEDGGPQKGPPSTRYCDSGPGYCEDANGLRLSHCSSSQTLLEYTCMEGFCSPKSTTCQYGCSNGACLTAPTTAKTTTTSRIRECYTPEDCPPAMEGCRYACISGKCQETCQTTTTIKTTTTVNYCDSGAGYCEDAIGLRLDYCESDSTLIKHYCNLGLCSSSKVSCYYGCKNNACSTAPTTTSRTTSSLTTSSTSTTRTTTSVAGGGGGSGGDLLI